MDKLEELLPGIDGFLTKTLSKEKLSSLAERQRQFYVERIEFLQQPPSLPPRPPAVPKVTDSPKLPPHRKDSNEEDAEAPPPPPPLRPRKSLLPRPHTYTPPPLAPTTTTITAEVHGEESSDTTGQEDFAAKQRRIAREASSDAILPPPLLPRAVHPVPPPVPDPIEDSDHYSDIDRDEGEDGRSLGGGSEDMYEVPTNVGDTPSSSNNNLADKISQKEPESDTESGTSYESYDDEHKHADEGEEVTVNKNDKQEDGDSLRSGKRKSRENIPLPRIKSKRKKKKSNKEKPEDAEPTVTAIKNITCRGDLYQKRKLMWARRYCVLADKCLLIYNSERDTKVLSTIPIPGYDVLFLEKEGRRYHVIRVAHPGMETHWFSAETKDESEIWFEHLLTAAGLADDVESETRSISSTDKILDIENPQILLTSISTESKEKGSTSTLSHGSEDGSTSTDHIPLSPNVSYIGDTSPKGKKSVGDKLSSFFSIGKKKGKKTSHAVNTDVETVEGSLYSPVSFEGATPSISIAGRFKVKRDPESEEWEEMYCQVKNGLFEVYEHHTDNKDILTFPLFGCEVMDAPEVKKDLAIKIAQGGNQKIVFEPSDPLEQGNWLNILIKATSKVRAPPVESNGNHDDEQQEPDKSNETAASETDFVNDSRNEIFSTSNDSLGYEHIYEESATLTESFLKALEDGGTFSSGAAAESSNPTTTKDEDVTSPGILVAGNPAIERVRAERMYDVPAEESSADEMEPQDYADIPGDRSSKSTENNDHVYDDVSMNSTSESVAASEKDDNKKKDSMNDVSAAVFDDEDDDDELKNNVHLWHDDHDIYESCFENQLEDATTRVTAKDSEVTSDTQESAIERDQDMLEKNPNPILAKIREEKLQRRKSAASTSSTESATSPLHTTQNKKGGKIKDIKKKLLENEKKIGGSEPKLNRKVNSLEKNVTSLSPPEDNKLNKSRSDSHLTRLAVTKLTSGEKTDDENILKRRSIQKMSTDSVQSSAETKSLDHLSDHIKHSNESLDKKVGRSSTASSGSSAASETVSIPSVTNSIKRDEKNASNLSLNSMDKSNMYAMPDKLTKRQSKPAKPEINSNTSENGDVYEDSAIVPPPKRGVFGSKGDVRSKDRIFDFMKKHRDSKREQSKSSKDGKTTKESKPQKELDSDSKEHVSKDRRKSHSKESLSEVKLRKHSSKVSVDSEEIDEEEVKKVNARIDELKGSLAEMKQQRSAIKEQKSLARNHSKKKALDEELRYIDNQHKNLERELDEEEHELSCLLRAKTSNLNRSGIRKSMREVKSRVQERLKQYEDLSQLSDEQ